MNTGSANGLACHRCIIYTCIFFIHFNFKWASQDDLKRRINDSCPPTRCLCHRGACARVSGGQANNLKGLAPPLPSKVWGCRTDGDWIGRGRGSATAEARLLEICMWMVMQMEYEQRVDLCKGYNCSQTTCVSYSFCHLSLLCKVNVVHWSKRLVCDVGDSGSKLCSVMRLSGQL